MLEYLIVPGTPPQRVAMAVGRDADGQPVTYLSHRGRTLTLAPPAPPTARRRDAAGGDADPEVRAPMTGRLTHVAVAEGDEVAAGALLAIVEAMKMEYRLLAPVAGRVHGLSAGVDQRVRAGERLLRLD